MLFFRPNFLIFAQNLQCGRPYTLELPQFWRVDTTYVLEQKLENNVNSLTTYFYYIKVGRKGVYITVTCLHDNIQIDIQLKLLSLYRSVWPRGYAKDSTSRGPRFESYVFFKEIFFNPLVFFFLFCGRGGGGVFTLLFGSSIFVCLIACVMFMATVNRRGRYYY